MSEYLIIAAASIALFWRAVHCGLVVDDVTMHPLSQEYKQLFRDKKIPFSELVWHVLQGAGLFKSVKLDYAFAAVLHTINACLVLKVSALLPAALFFLVSPINNQVALWLNGRRYSISIFCVLASWAFWPAAIVLYPFAAWIHISGTLFPLLFLTTSFAWVVPIGAAVFGLVGFKTFKERAIGRMSQYPANSELFRIHWGKAVFYFKHIGYYFRIILFPIKPRMYHEFHFYFPRYQWAIDKAYKIDFEFAFGAAVVAFLGYEMAVNHNFWAFFFVLFISQYCGVFTTTMNVADRYCSLAGIGLYVILAQKIMLLPQPYAYFVLGAVLASYAVIYNPLIGYAYKSWERFLLYHTHIEPAGTRQRLHLAQFYLKLKDPFAAFYIIKKGLKQNSLDFDLLVLMTNVAMILGNHDQALKMIAQAETCIPLNDEKDCTAELERLKSISTSILNQNRTNFEAKAKKMALAGEARRQMAKGR